MLALPESLVSEHEVQEVGHVLSAAPQLNLVPGRGDREGGRVPGTVATLEFLVEVFSVLKSGCYHPAPLRLYRVLALWRVVRAVILL